MQKPASRLWRFLRLSCRVFALLLVVGVLAGVVAYWRSSNDCPEVGKAEPADAINTWIYCEYGSPDVLRLARLPRPALKDSQVLVRLRATSINAGDWHMLRGEPIIARFAMGLRKPSSTRLGSDFSGVVEAVGSAVTRFSPGDSVWGATSAAFADRVVLRESRVLPKPANITFEQAAAVPVAALTALQGLRNEGLVHAGHHVLVNGASGGVGTFTVQIAKELGATVTGVCSTRNVDLVRSLGADRVIDYTRDDFASDSQRYDVVIDNVGNRSLSDLRRVLKPGGRVVLIGAGSGRWFSSIPRLLTVMARQKLGDQGTRFFIAEVNEPDLAQLNSWMAAGKVTPAIDRTFPFSELPQAIRYVEEGARAKVVVTLEETSPPPAP